MLSPHTDAVIVPCLSVDPSAHVSLTVSGYGVLGAMVEQSAGTAPTQVFSVIGPQKQPFSLKRDLKYLPWVED